LATGKEFSSTLKVLVLKKKNYQSIIFMKTNRIEILNPARFEDDHEQKIDFQV